MAYPKQTSLYSSEFYRLACELSDHPETPLLVECKNAKAAMALRLQFYAFRNAARASKATGGMAHFPNIDIIEVTIPKIEGKNGNVVHFHNKDTSELSLTLKEALDKREQQGLR